MSKLTRTGWPWVKPWSAPVRRRELLAGERHPEQAVRAHRLVDVDRWPAAAAAVGGGRVTCSGRTPRITSRPRAGTPPS